MKDKLTPLSQTLRKNMTPQERQLWYCFLKTYPVRFHRQYVIDRYIVDFYCHKAKLVIELDGSQHYDPAEAEKDQIRTEVLQSHGVKVLRFSNRDMAQNFPAVCEAIDTAIKSNL